jgi:hypothetical protein
MRDLYARTTAAIRIRLGQRGHVHNREITPGQARELSESPLGDIFFAHEGRPIHKWVHCLDLYERHFGAFRGKPVRFLEIGVWQGGSLEMWRKFFGPDATIYGVDIDLACKTRADDPNQIRIGSQDDPDFLRSVVREMGGIDIILDDGSHVGRHQWKSFRTLFPMLPEGGIYAIEDLHTAYWPGMFEGGYKRRGTGIELVKDLIDDMHGWWHDKDCGTPREQLGAIHAYDSIAFIEKANRAEPKTTKVLVS